MPATSITLLARLGAEPDNSGAWARFVVLYGPHIIRWCRRYGLQDSDAEDVSQEVLIQLSKQMAQFRYDPSKRFRGWLRTVVHSSWYAWASRRREWHRGTGDDAIIDQLEAESARDELLARIDAEFDRELFQIACKLVRDRVESHTWEAFRLMAIDGLEGKQAADRLGMRLNSTYAARNKVQKLIRDEVLRLDPPD